MRSIEITTTQNVTIEYELAELRLRAIGLVMDFIIAAIGYLILVVVLRRLTHFDPIDSLPMHVTWIIFPLIAFFFYNIGLEIGNSGQTIGKMATGTKTIRLDGKDPEWGDVLMRSVLHLVDSLTSFGIIGAILIKTTDQCQRLGDMAANTTVIKIRSSSGEIRLNDILSIQSLSNYQPIYPQVRNLSERDMIFIKTLLTRLQNYPNRAHELAVEDLVTHLMPILGVETRPLNRIDFLKTLLRDYIVLTR